MTEERHKNIIRLEVENGKVVSATLNQVGADGEKSMHRLAAGVTRADDRLNVLTRSILTRLVPALSVGALTRATRTALKDMGDLADRAERLGASVEDLQVWEQLGEDIGIGGERAAEGLGEFIKRIGQAQAGSGKALEVLKDYNIELTDGAGNARGWGAILGDVANVIANTADQQERLRIASAVGMEDMVQALAMGRDGLEEYRNKLVEVGLVLDEEIIRKADQFDKAWSRSLLRISLGFKRLAVDFIDQVNDIGIAWEKMLDRLRFNREHPFRSGQGDLSAASAQVGEYSAAVHSGKDDFYSVVGIPRPGMGPVSGSAGSSRAAKDAAREEEKIRGVIAALEEKLIVNERELELTRALRQAGVERYSEEGQHIEALVNQHQDFLRAQEDQKLAAKRIKEEWDRNREAAERYGAAVGDIIEGFDDLHRFGLQVLADLAESMVSLGFGGEAADGLGGIIAEALFGGSSSGKIIYDEPVGPFLPGRASGGPVSAGQSYWVGERGPEILRMGGMGGTVVPNHALGSATSAPIVNIHNYSSSSVQTREGHQGGQKTLEVMIDEAVARNMTSPGTRTSRALRRFGSQPATGR